jgi:hypothetical protein
VKDKLNDRILSRSDFVDFCGICGMALTQYEITAEINGGVVLYDEKKTGNIQLTLCADCKNRIMETSLAGLNAAIVKRLEIDNSLTVNLKKVRRPKTETKKTQKKFINDRDDDEDKDDGSGGVKAILPP